MQRHAGRAHARGVPQPVQADTADAQSLGHGADRPQCVPGVDCRPALRDEHQAVWNQIEAAMIRWTTWLALTPAKSATAAGERGTLRRVRSVLGFTSDQVPVDP